MLKTLCTISTENRSWVSSTLPIRLYMKLTELALKVLLSSSLKKVDHVVKFTKKEGMGMTRDKAPSANSI